MEKKVSASSGKENRATGPRAPWRSERRVQKNVGVSLYVGDRSDAVVPPYWADKATGQAVEQSGVQTGGLLIPCGKAFWKRDPRLIQTNLLGSCQPLKEAPSQQPNSCFQQQSNLQPCSWRSRRAPNLLGKSQEKILWQRNQSLYLEEQPKRILLWKPEEGPGPQCPRGRHHVLGRLSPPRGQPFQIHQAAPPTSDQSTSQGLVGFDKVPLFPTQSHCSSGSVSGNRDPHHHLREPFFLEGLGPPCKPPDPSASFQAMQAVFQATHTSALLPSCMQRFRQEVALIELGGSQGDSEAHLEGAAPDDCLPGMLRGRGLPMDSAVATGQGLKTRDLGAAESSDSPTKDKHVTRCVPRAGTGRLSLSERSWTDPVSTVNANSLADLETKARPSKASLFLGAKRIWQASRKGEAHTGLPFGPFPPLMPSGEEYPPGPAPDGVQVSWEMRPRGGLCPVGVSSRGAALQVDSVLAQQFSLDKGGISQGGEGSGTPARRGEASHAAAGQKAPESRDPSAGLSTCGEEGRQDQRDCDSDSESSHKLHLPGAQGAAACCLGVPWGRDEARLELDPAEKTPMVTQSQEDRDPGQEDEEQLQDALQGEVSAEGTVSLKNKQTRDQASSLLSQCFGAWRCHMLGKLAAQHLYRQQLLRKGIRALWWAVQLRDIQLDSARRTHSRGVLIRSFRKWKETSIKQKERKQLVLAEPSSPPADSRTAEGGGRRGPHRKQYCCSAGNQKGLMELLPSAFRLCHLQKEQTARAEARLEEARAVLGRKRLQRVFQAWHCRSIETAWISPLVAQSQKNQLGQCFGAWRCQTQRTALCQATLAERRVESLRRCLWQWARMLRLRDMDRKLMAQFYFCRPRMWPRDAQLGMTAC
ncbi:uncharacterized protein LOC119928776 [Tachyglossus aculeatus]|uniref:uncharacterized protein LOC119928776 n=1 Tax=Tachyglossus aculeatus TaxID=9261 RepID=UPI0018F4D780|nr:uncharacterized protein LOC119928776 [Tachyglossus aculeatus]